MTAALHVVLVGCCAEKLTTIAPARLLYRSQLFRKSAAWAERHGDEWRVISAAYGLIKPDQQLASYDCPMSRLTESDRSRWDRGIARHLDLIADSGDLRITLLAGQSYSGWVQLVQPWCTVEQPLAGMAIGLRMQWLSRQLGEIQFEEAIG